jgi:hypothetical protein
VTKVATRTSTRAPSRQASRPSRPTARRPRPAARRASRAQRAGQRAPQKAAAQRAPQRWTATVTRESRALDLEPKVFTKSTAAAIAQSLKRSAERSRRRKATAFRSAMSMLTFYINRAGRNLPRERQRILENAKSELRRAFGRPA